MSLECEMMRNAPIPVTMGKQLMYALTPPILSLVAIIYWEGVYLKALILSHLLGGKPHDEDTEKKHGVLSIKIMNKLG